MEKSAGDARLERRMSELEQQQERLARLLNLTAGPTRAPAPAVEPAEGAARAISREDRARGAVESSRDTRAGAAKPGLDSPP